MVTTLAGQFDQLEEALLEGPGSELDGTEDHLWASLGTPGAASLLVELRRVVRDEVTVLPIAVEHGGELVDDVRIARRRGPDVPLEASHLCRMREIRRPDIRRREPRAT